MCLTKSVNHMQISKLYIDKLETIKVNLEVQLEDTQNARSGNVDDEITQFLPVTHRVDSACADLRIDPTYRDGFKEGGRI